MIYISPHYVRVALESAERKGLKPHEICSAVGIDEESLQNNERIISAEQFCRLWQYLWDTLDDEFLGFTHKPCKRGTFVIACKVASQTSNINQVIREMNRIYELIDSDLTINTETFADKTSVLQLHNASPECDIDHFITEYMLFYWHRLICWISNTKIKPIRAEFAYPEPKHAELYNDLYPCPATFNAAKTQLVFNENFLDIPVCRSRTELYDFLNRLPADFMSLPGEDSTLSTQIKVLLLNQSGEQLAFPSIEQLAETLGMSRTSLGRKLSIENTSYRQLKELIRRDIVMEKLHGSTMNISDIAELAGFAEQTSLNRAFKNWTGMTPQQFRGQKKTTP